MRKRWFAGGLLGGFAGLAILAAIGTALGFARGFRPLGTGFGGYPPETLEGAGAVAVLFIITLGLPVAGIGFAAGAIIAHRTRKRSEG